MHLHQHRTEQVAIMQLLEKHKAALLDNRHVCDLGVGFRIVNNKPTDELGIIIHVDIKKQKLLRIADLNLPKEIEGIPVDVVEVLQEEVLRSDFDELHPHIRDISNFRNQLFPQLLGGIRIKNAQLRGEGGTLGAIVYDRDTHEAYGLTSRHVLINDKILQLRKTATVIQPNHEKNARSIIGTVRSNKQINPDCIRFKIEAQRPIAKDGSVLGIEGRVQGVEKDVFVGTKVFKSGARTGVTYGIISCLNICTSSFTILPDDDYDLIDGELTLPGDSGAVWLVNDGSMRAIGLHCLGNHSRAYDEEMAMAIKMSTVVEHLNIVF